MNSKHIRLPDELVEKVTKYQQEKCLVTFNSAIIEMLSKFSNIDAEELSRHIREIHNSIDSLTNRGNF